MKLFSVLFLSIFCVACIQNNHNQSDYLKTIDKISLPHSQPSQYQLRKNQPQGGLCTAECVIELFKLNKSFQIAEKLQSKFMKFNNLR